MTENNSYRPQENGGQPQPPSYAQYMGYNSPTAPVEKPAVPVQTRAAIYIMYAIVALSLTSALLTALFPLQMVSVLREGRFGVNYSSLPNHEYFSLLATLGLIFEFIFCTAYVIFAIFARRGANWARIVVTVIFGLSIFDLLQVLTADLSRFTLPTLVALLGVISALLAIAGIVLLWLAPSNDYYKSMKTYRQWRVQSAQYR